MVLFFNFPSIWDHALFGAAEGPSLILDFVGLPHQPSKLHLLLLDLVIITFSYVLVTISYEHSLPTANTSETTTSILGPHEPSEHDNPSKAETSPYIVDLRLGPMVDRIRNPAPPPVERPQEGLLPLPNTMPAELRHSIRMLLRAREDVTTGRPNNNREQRRMDPSEPGNRGVPGAIEPDDDN